MTAARLWMLSCFLGGVLLAQPSLRITSPPDGTVVHPGDSLQVKVEASEKFLQVVIISGDPIGFSVPHSVPPDEFTVKIPANIVETRYPLTYPLTADGCISVGHCVSSKPITIVVEFPSPQIRLKVQPSLLRLTAGDKGSLKVLGVFPDGITMDLTPSMQISFTSDAPKIAVVDATSGVISAMAPGSARITATYRDSHVDVPVTVVAKQP